jgi:thiamine kinase
MSRPLQPPEALARVPGWDPAKARFRRLEGGLTNQTYRVAYGGRDYVLRIDIDDANILRPERDCEADVLRAAHDADLGPAVVHADADAGILLTTYLPGRVWGEQDLAAADSLERLAATMRRVHDLPRCGRSVRLHAQALDYASFIGEQQGPHPFAAQCVDVIRRLPTGGEVVCCHNDVIAANIVDDGDLKLLDWEYARDNDPMFELAVTIGYHDLDRYGRDVLLEAYTGGSGGAERERLQQQLRAYDALQWLWFATRQLVDPDRKQAARLEALQRRIR